MSARETILARIRAALDTAGDPGPALPPVAEVPARGGTAEDFAAALERLGGKAHFADSAAGAGEKVRAILAGRDFVCSDSPTLRACGLPAVEGDVSQASVGVTSADYALADTGSLVVLAASEPRLYSLLPPVHVAVLPRDRILSGLNELLATMPNPSAHTSSMVLITGPSRTADIEQILIRGVHGPGELEVVIY